MKTAGVRELKAHLSSYLRDVDRGDVILVTDRGRVVAELRPPGAAERALSPGEVRYRKLVAEGRLRPATSPSSVTWPASPRRLLKKGSSADLLDAEREE